MTMTLDDNYFTLDSKEVMRNQMQELTSKTVKLCNSLPMQALMSA